ncbi:NUDIX hydrolase [Peptostreptococcus sp. D1]|uniref:NUDIX hydrolase n=1 Tax=Peptostreptococcus sp. D1 TaxID=72304 RepID=UPI0008E1342E|nr:CoA pyrophosphatase [Peptostreptococcus sp. D1]SFE45318.1 NUDIX domain-containing protein [Peptostreptococcus sp. D1]
MENLIVERNKNIECHKNIELEYHKNIECYKNIDLEAIFSNHCPDVISSQKILLSSVVIPVINIDGVDNILLEVRGNKLKHQPGEISFPGGKMEPHEKPIDTAVREFCEELMCNEDSIDIISELNQYIAPNKGIIYTFLGRVKGIDLGISNDEVDRLLPVPISFFKTTQPKAIINKLTFEPADDFPFEEMRIPKDYFDFKVDNEVIFYKYENEIIWGITAYIIRDFVSKII